MKNKSAYLKYCIEAYELHSLANTYFRRLPELVGEAEARLLAVFTKTIFVNSFNNFTTYLADLLEERFQKYPEAIGEIKIEARDLVKYSNIETAIKIIAHDRVNALSRGSVKTLVEYFHKESILLFPDKTTEDKAIKLGHYRNLVTHNRSKINGVYKSVYRNEKVNIGDKIPLTPEEWLGYIGFFDDIVSNIHRQAVSKNWSMPEEPELAIILRLLKNLRDLTHHVKTNASAESDAKKEQYISNMHDCIETLKGMDNSQLILLAIPGAYIPE